MTFVLNGALGFGLGVAMSMAGYLIGRWISLRRHRNQQ